MKITRNILTLVLLSAGLSFAGVYEKQVVTPAPLCGPWYMSLFGGGSFFDNGEFNGGDEVLAAGESATFGFDNGWMAGAAVGVRTANDWRFEIEGSHSQAPGGDAVFSFADVVVPGLVGIVGTGTGDLRGDVETSSLMLNVAKEFGGLTFWNLRPYVGAGVGLSSVRTDLRTSTTLVDAGGTLGTLNNHYYGDEVVLGYQAMAGLVLDITECLQLYLEYRLTGHGDPEDVTLDREFVATDPAAFDLVDGGDGFGDLDLGFQQHALIGVRWFF